MFSDIVSPHPFNHNKFQVMCVDNDQAFVPAFVQQSAPSGIPWFRSVIVQVKTVLYCLPQMNKPLPPALRVVIANTNAFEFLLEWLQQMKRYDERQRGFFTPAQLSNYIQDEGCCVGVPFQKGFVRHIYEKWTLLRNLLFEKPEITLMELLSALEFRLASR